MKRWEKRIAEAKARGEFTQEDKKLAKAWVTCACGEQDPRIKRKRVPVHEWWGGRGEPCDADLARLGGDFYQAVLGGAFGSAALILELIEKRAFQLVYLPPELFEEVQAILNQQPQAHQDCLASVGVV